MKFYQTLYTIGKLTFNQLKENQVIQFMLYSEYQGRTHTHNQNRIREQPHDIFMHEMRETHA